MLPPADGRVRCWALRPGVRAMRLLLLTLALALAGAQVSLGPPTILLTLALAGAQVSQGPPTNGHSMAGAGQVIDLQHKKTNKK